MANPHGVYEISRQDRTLFVSISGSWNLEAYREFSAAFMAAAMPLRESPWGAIVDIRQWGLSVPEIAAADRELQLWTLQNQQRWRAFISEHSALKAQQIESHATPVQDTICTRFFESPDAARSWFQELGLLGPD